MIDKLFTRDNIVWNLTLAGSILTLAATMLTSWFTPDHARQLGEFAGFLGAAAGMFGNSPLPHSKDL